MDTKEIERIAESFVKHDILLNQSALVDAMLKEELFEYDDIDNLYPNPDNWNLSDCEAWLLSRNIDLPERDDFIDDGASYESNLRELIEDHREAKEVFEWWAVTSTLATELKAIGEPVLYNDYGYWWGRTCTGQSIILDGTMQTIAKLFLDRTLNRKEV